MQQRKDATAPGATNSEGGNGTQLAAETNQYQYSELSDVSTEQQRLVGAYMHAPPSVRQRVDQMIAPGDLDPTADDALSVIRSGCEQGLTTVGDLAQFFVDTVNERRRQPRKTGDPLPVRYQPGPGMWIACAFTSVARMPDLTSAVVLALPFAGTGRRRTIAHVAAELVRAAENLAFDNDDVDAAAERLLRVLGVSS